MSSPQVWIGDNVGIYLHDGTLDKPEGEVEVIFYPKTGSPKFVRLDIKPKLLDDGKGGIIPVVAIEEKKQPDG